MNIAADFDGVGVTARLTRLVASGSLPRAMEASCASLIERLKAPVQIGIFGLPGAGKRHVLNALQGAPIVPHSPLVPTLEVVPGPVEHVNAILGDGATLSAPGPLTHDLLNRRPVFLTLTNPMNLNNNTHYLLVVCDPTVADMSAGLQWAAGRVDVALWCSKDWTKTEEDIWLSAPETLHNHAVLCMTGQGVVKPAHVAGFESVIALSGDPAQVVRAVSAKLDQLIAEAVTQDYLSAEYFLQRFEPVATRTVTQAPAPATAENVVPLVPPEAVSELSQLFRKLRRGALGLRQQVFAAQVDGLQAVDALSDLLEVLADDAEMMDHLVETWPDLHLSLAEARDLAVLLRLEGGHDQAEDAASLLLQLRQDMECKLAA